MVSSHRSSGSQEYEHDAAIHQSHCGDVTGQFSAQKNMPNPFSIGSFGHDDRHQAKSSSSLWPFFRVGQEVHRQSLGRRTGGSKASQPTSSPWTMQDFDISKEVGKGKYGVVFKAKYKSGTSNVAIKRFNKKRILKDERKGGKALELLRREIEIHSQ
jgi:hypothetical protein